MMVVFQCEGDPGQCAVNAEDTGGGGEMQRRASPTTGSRGEPDGLLPSQSPSATARGARTGRSAASLTAGGAT